MIPSRASHASGHDEGPAAAFRSRQLGYSAMWQPEAACRRSEHSAREDWSTTRRTAASQPEFAHSVPVRASVGCVRALEALNCLIWSTKQRPMTVSRRRRRRVPATAGRGGVLTVRAFNRLIGSSSRCPRPVRRPGGGDCAPGWLTSCTRVSQSPTGVLGAIAWSTLRTPRTAPPSRWVGGEVGLCLTTHWAPGGDSVVDAVNAANRSTIQVGRLRGRPLPDDPLGSWRRQRGRRCERREPHHHPGG